MNLFVQAMEGVESFMRRTVTFAETVCQDVLNDVYGKKIQLCLEVKSTDGD